MAAKACKDSKMNDMFRPVGELVDGVSSHVDGSGFQHDDVLDALSVRPRLFVFL